MPTALGVPMDMTGRVVGGYRLVERLGRGGMGMVYRAERPDTHPQVALKVMHAHLASDEAYRERFLREGRAARGRAAPGGRRGAGGPG